MLIHYLVKFRQNKKVIIKIIHYYEVIYIM